jgi:hypothetical protein
MRQSSTSLDVQRLEVITKENENASSETQVQEGKRRRKYVGDSNI